MRYGILRIWKCRSVHFAVGSYNIMASRVAHELRCTCKMCVLLNSKDKKKVIIEVRKYERHDFLQAGLTCCLQLKTVSIMRCSAASRIISPHFTRSFKEIFLPLFYQPDYYRVLSLHRTFRAFTRSSVCDQRLQNKITSASYFVFLPLKLSWLGTINFLASALVK